IRTVLRLAVLNRTVRGNGPATCLILLLARFLAITFARQGFLHTAFFAGLEIKRVPLDFLDDVLLLDLSFKAAQGIFKRFTLLEPDFSQVRLHLPTYLVGNCWTLLSFAVVLCPSQGVSGRKCTKNTGFLRCLNLRRKKIAWRLQFIADAPAF